jgi:hypothetical protein
MILGSPWLLAASDLTRETIAWPLSLEVTVA